MNEMNIFWDTDGNKKEGSRIECFLLQNCVSQKRFYDNQP